MVVWWLPLKKYGGLVAALKKNGGLVAALKKQTNKQTKNNNGGLVAALGKRQYSQQCIGYVLACTRWFGTRWVALLLVIIRN